MQRNDIAVYRVGEARVYVQGNIDVNPKARLLVELIKQDRLIGNENKRTLTDIYLAEDWRGLQSALITEDGCGGREKILLTKDPVPIHGLWELSRLSLMAVNLLKLSDIPLREVVKGMLRGVDSLKNSDRFFVNNLIDVDVDTPFRLSHSEDIDLKQLSIAASLFRALKYWEGQRQLCAEDVKVFFGRDSTLLKLFVQASPPAFCFEWISILLQFGFRETATMVRQALSKYYPYAKPPYALQEYLERKLIRSDIAQHSQLFRQVWLGDILWLGNSESGTQNYQSVSSTLGEEVKVEKLSRFSDDQLKQVAKVCKAIGDYEIGRLTSKILLENACDNRKALAIDHAEFCVLQGRYDEIELPDNYRLPIGYQVVNLHCVSYARRPDLVVRPCREVVGKFLPDLACNTDFLGLSTSIKIHSLSCELIPLNQVVEKVLYLFPEKKNSALLAALFFTALWVGENDIIEQKRWVEEIDYHRFNANDVLCYALACLILGEINCARSSMAWFVDRFPSHLEVYGGNRLGLLFFYYICQLSGNLEVADHIERMGVLTRNFYHVIKERCNKIKTRASISVKGITYSILESAV